MGVRVQFGDLDAKQIFAHIILDDFFKTENLDVFVPVPIVRMPVCEDNLMC